MRKRENTDQRKDNKNRNSDKPFKKPFRKDERSDKPFKKEHKKDDRSAKPFRKEHKKEDSRTSTTYDPFKKKYFDKRENVPVPKSSPEKEKKEFKPRDKKEFNPKDKREFKPKDRKDFKSRDKIFKPFKKKIFRKEERLHDAITENSDGRTRLNKFIANAGVCSRREADQFIASGVVKVNGSVVIELGYKINPGDVVQFDGQTLNAEKKVYLLLNKPKDYITTADDPEGRKTVLDLIKGACKERVYPVGRLDRNTSGLLLLTNDGDLTKKLTHPRFGIKKTYNVTVDKNIKTEHLDKLVEGVELEDGKEHVDTVYYVGQGTTKNHVVVELHSGKNRIVRRLFEALGYVVTGLDRTHFAGLTKKNLPRAKWRILNETEVGMLKMIS